MAALRAHRKRQVEELLATGFRPRWPLVFLSEAATPLLEANLIRRHFKPILERADLPREVRIHDLRHTCASLLLAAGANPREVSELLGHSTVAFTLSVYAHVLPGAQERLAQRMEAILHG
ncbi:MAG: tyrosine-type recombinase/integrase [Bacillota bacterium]|nr:tyrosine-type recombinase/integrase [Bacillota bacterium]